MSGQAVGGGEESRDDLSFSFLCSFPYFSGGWCVPRKCFLGKLDRFCEASRRKVEREVGV